MVLCTLLVPQVMAYAELAGLPAITGLYTTVVCLVAYALFGSSRFINIGSYFGIHYHKEHCQYSPTSKKYKLLDYKMSP